MLSVAVSFMLKSGLGVSAWDALVSNIVLGTNGNYRLCNALFSLVLAPISYLMQKKKITYKVLLPCVISFFIGLGIDIGMVVLPDANQIIFKILYLAISFVLIGIALNMVILNNFVVPAIDDFGYAVGHVFNKSFGVGKTIAEVFALLLAILLGIIFGLSDSSNIFEILLDYNIGIGTIVYTLIVGLLIDVFYKLLFKKRVENQS